MKVIDKFLKKLHTTRNNFATYVLTLISLYLVVDRMTEILLIILTFCALEVEYSEGTEKA